MGIRVNDAARPRENSWGIYRVRAVTEHRVLLEADSDLRWFATEDVEYLHTPRRWAGWEND